jgi:hypothetical protein
MQTCKRKSNQAGMQWVRITHPTSARAVYTFNISGTNQLYTDIGVYTIKDILRPIRNNVETVAVYKSSARRRLLAFGCSASASVTLLDKSGREPGLRGQWGLGCRFKVQDSGFKVICIYIYV